MGNGRKWTEAEYEYLQEKWGRLNIPQLADKLHRSENAVKLKIVRMGLGRAIINANCLNARQLSDLMKVDIHTVTDYWIPKCGLKAKKKAPHGRHKQIFIRYENLMIWLKNNQDKWDSRKLELYAFGQEPDWLKEKRKNDSSIPKNRFKKWTPAEDTLLCAMFKSGRYTYQQIGDRMNRSRSSIDHRIKRIDVWGSGRYKAKNEGVKIDKNIYSSTNGNV